MKTLPKRHPWIRAKELRRTMVPEQGRLMLSLLLLSQQSQLSSSVEIYLKSVAFSFTRATRYDTV
jgi:hypothetical protein